MVAATPGVRDRYVQYASGKAQEFLVALKSFDLRSPGYLSTDQVHTRSNVLVEIERVRRNG